MDLRSFTDGDLPSAAALLDAREARARARHPLVAAFDTTAAVAALLADGARGWVAYDGGACRGYLLGSVTGDEAWVQYAGTAATDVAAYRLLYAAASADWVAAGAYRHAVYVPDGDPVAEPAFANLAFGREHVFALGSVSPVPQQVPGIDVRLATIADADTVVAMGDLVARHLSGPPVWSPRDPAYYASLPDLWREELANDEVACFVASLDGTDVGMATWEPMPPRPGIPTGTVAFSHAAVRPEARGRGAGRALDAAGRAWARDRGYTVTWSDWRLTNLLAEPYWRHRGWTPYTVRLTRRVEPGAGN